MYELHLFAGGGGGILAGQLLGHKTICAVEIEPFAQAILCARQDDGIFPAFPIWDDVTSFSESNPATKPIICQLREVASELVVCGGFPCQDISSAGGGKGLAGAKSSLFFEYMRIVREIRPAYIFMENSPVIASRGLDIVLSSLAESGYDAEWTVLGADDCAAPHIRKRWWCLAYNKKERRGASLPKRNISNQSRHTNASYSCGLRNVAYSHQNDDRVLQDNPSIFCSKKQSSCHLPKREWYRNGHIYGSQSEQSGRRELQRSHQSSQTESRSLLEVGEGIKSWPAESNILRMAHGVAHRSHRISALGNGQVPRVAATAFTLLMNRINPHAL